MRDTTSMEKKYTPIPGFSGYCADESGFIWSIKSNWRGYGERILAEEISKHGYRKVRVYKDGKRTKQSVHKLICLAFNGARKSSLHEVRHLNGKRLDCRPCNLEWGTRSENAKDRTKHGLEVGRYGNNQKLHLNQVKEIRKRYKQGLGPTLAKEFNVTPETITGIARMKTWKPA